MDRPSQPGVDVAGSLLPVADGHGHRALGGDHVTAGEDSGMSGHHVRAHLDHPVIDDDVRGTLHEGQVRLLAQGQDQRVSGELFELACGLGKSLVVEHHLLEHELLAFDRLDRREPLHAHALFDGLLNLDVVGGHPVS